MKTIVELARGSELIQGVCLEVRSPESGRSTWHPMKAMTVKGKWDFDKPVDLAPGLMTLIFWRKSEVVLTREVEVPDEGWTVTSFWPSWCAAEADQQFPGFRVYTRRLEILQQDPDPVL